MTFCKWRDCHRFIQRRVANNQPPALPEPYTVAESTEALTLHNEVIAKCEALYDAAKTQSEKALRYLRDYGVNGSLTHGQLLRYLHIDSDMMRKVIDSLMQSELIVAEALSRGGFRYTLVSAA